MHIFYYITRPTIGFSLEIGVINLPAVFPQPKMSTINFNKRYVHRVYFSYSSSLKKNTVYIQDQCYFKIYVFDFRISYLNFILVSFEIKIVLKRPL